MERYLKIASVNWRFNLFPHVIVALIFCFIAPFIVGIENLDSLQTAKVLEVYISLLGIILLVPLFVPDEDKNVRDLIKSKKESMLTIHLIGIIEAIVVLMIFIAGFLYLLQIKSCEFLFASYFYGTMASCIFIGGGGVFIYGMVDSLPVGYMVPMLYYVMCFGGGKKYLGKFYLFSMMGGSVEDKKYLLICGIIMLVLGIVFRNINIFKKYNNIRKYAMIKKVK